MLVVIDDTNSVESDNGPIGSDSDSSLDNLSDVATEVNRRPIEQSDNNLPLCDFMSIVAKENIDYRTFNNIEKESYYKRFVLNSGATKNFLPSFVLLDFQKFLMTYYSKPKDHFRFNTFNFANTA